MRYAWIDQQRDDYPLKLLCRVLKVSRSGYYAWRRREPSVTARRRQQIGQAAQESHRDSHGTYGYRRVHRDLVDDHEIACCRETVRRVMAELGLSGRHPRRFVKTTDSNHQEPIAANRLQRDFTATRPDQKWLADITYLRLTEGWLYLAVVLDCFSRRIVGWSLSRQIDATLVCTALEMALRRPVSPGQSGAPLRPRRPVCLGGVARTAATGGADDEYVPQREPVGQCHDGELLRVAQDRMDRHRVRHGSPSTNGGVQVHRDVL